LSHDFLYVGRLLRRGDVASRLDEGAELRVGDIRFVHPEAVHTYAMGRLLLGPGQLGVAAHGELAARDPHHPGWTDGRGPQKGHHRIGRAESNGEESTQNDALTESRRAEWQRSLGSPGNAHDCWVSGGPTRCHPAK